MKPPPEADAGASEDRRPRKSLGQHFLNSGRIVNRMIEALGAGPTDTVVEVGPGRGALTHDLAAACGRLILVEKDERFAAEHARRFADDPRVEVHEDDATTFDLADVAPPGAGLLVIGNLPYNAGGPILFNLLRRRDRIARLVLMFQREVAQRLCAPPGDRNHGAVSVLVRTKGDIRLLLDVSPGKFVPPPKVWSSVVLVEPAGADPSASAVADDPAFERFAHAVFAQPRKTVINSLSDGLGRPKETLAPALAAAGIDPAARPSAVTVAQVVALFQNSARFALTCKEQT